MARPPFSGINVVSIAVPDLTAARAWYMETCGLGEPEFDLPEYGWIEFRTGGAGNLALVPAPESWEPNTNVTIVLNTADCFETHKEFVERGIRCDEPVVFEGYVTYCSFYDPWGNRLQMCSDSPKM
jgi:predicted enzyme related to lactoylglutathione lyase